MPLVKLSIHDFDEIVSFFPCVQPIIAIRIKSAKKSHLGDLPGKWSDV